MTSNRATVYKNHTIVLVYSGNSRRFHVYCPDGKFLSTLGWRSMEAAKRAINKRLSVAA